AGLDEPQVQHVGILSQRAERRNLFDGVQNARPYAAIASRGATRASRVQCEILRQVSNLSQRHCFGMRPEQQIEQSRSRMRRRANERYAHESSFHLRFRHTTRTRESDAGSKFWNG